MASSYEIDAFVDDEGKRKPFYLRISNPVKTEGEDDYYCQVHAPFLFKKDKSIYGVDKEQARALAMQFVKQILGDKRLIDQDGNPMHLK